MGCALRLQIVRADIPGCDIAVEADTVARIVLIKIRQVRHIPRRSRCRRHFRADKTAKVGKPAVPLLVLRVLRERHRVQIGITAIKHPGPGATAIDEKAGTVSAVSALAGELRALDATARELRLRAHVLIALARVLKLPGGELPDPRQGFADQGVDSLMAVELKNRLAADIGVALPATLVFDYPDAERLTRNLLSRLQPPA